MSRNLELSVYFEFWKLEFQWNHGEAPSGEEHDRDRSNSGTALDFRKNMVLNFWGRGNRRWNDLCDRAGRRGDGQRTGLPRAENPSHAHHSGTFHLKLLFFEKKTSNFLGLSPGSRGHDPVGRGEIQQTNRRHQWWTSEIKLELYWLKILNWAFSRLLKWWSRVWARRSSRTGWIWPWRSPWTRSKRFTSARLAWMRSTSSDTAGRR